MANPYQPPTDADGVPAVETLGPKLATIALATGLVMGLGIAGAALADDLQDDETPIVTQDDAEVWMEAGNSSLAVDEDEGAVDIRAGDASVYADRTGRVDIRAPGFTLRAGPN